MPVTSFDKELKILADNMLKTMYESEGIGLSAIQIGVLKRVIVIDITEELKKPLILINPEITPSSNKFLEIKEGCLSFPGIYESVKEMKKSLWIITVLKGKNYL